MAKKQATQTLRKKERVKAATDLVGVPEGTEGRVILSNGFDWVRYWVHFDNGVEMGSLHRDKLVRAKEWDIYLVEREQAAELAATVDESEADGEAATEDAEGSSGGGDGATVNGVVVPQLLLDRTQAALDRFGVSR
ncbi:MAG: hypothetical protein ACR2PK_17940 [Acidimicrobiales bacterium]